ncbi:hypothetical protein [Falsiroseomonas sp.]|uniref:hypothetical protein n=1 Tax=Falsiroseomonas sp. TaxID=2870721 RepID=UPI0027169462|nr:hypothetical protein [Falsiroseomonas sp.]MDO9499026.1 hypothetical protein [Falsiroseomonas sp.]
MADGTVISLPPPARHWDLLRHMEQLGFSREAVIDAAQGFVTSDGAWATRSAAFAIADRAGQLPAKTFQPSTLFSEDLW